jgi:glycolate oxidase FAD binding subunit
LPSVSEIASIREAAEVLREAARAGTTVSIGREGGDVVLSTARLDRLVEHEAGDLTCTVEAGMRLSALKRVLAERGQTLALDPPGDPTIGACVGANLSGPRSHRYGGPRDLLLGVVVVLGDGLVAHSGGKVVKNVAGYDLGKLFCGSEGRLGLVARASLRLHPLPDVERTLVVPVAEPDEVRRLLAELRRSSLVPSAVDLLWPGKLCLLFEGSARAVDVQLSAARALVGGEEGDPWAEVLAFQASCAGRRPFDGELGEPRLVRTGEAYVREPVERPWSGLAERVRAALDPEGVLV